MKMPRMVNLIDHLAALFQQGKPFPALAQELCDCLRGSFSHYNWAGVYMLEGGDTLALLAWSGPAATDHVRIPVGQGICGLAAREKRSVIVDDVRQDPRYLQCFLNTRSEIVVPILRGQEVLGEIDIDGDRVAAFNDLDRFFLEWCAAGLARAFAGGGSTHR